LFFRRSELEAFFPVAVLDYMVRHAVPYARKHHSDPDPDPAFDGLLELPKDRLPVLVAARLSLSFPVLFSAVPLWAIDYEPPRNARALRRCRFSDGGICSNFPIHMFDAAIPQWPTFGISLGPQTLYRNEPVNVTRRHYEGREDRWYRFDDEEALLTGEKVPPLERLIGFLGSLLYSAKDWNDRTATRMPGVRDRIANVALESQGGLDLRISGDRIMELAGKYGQPAGRRLVEKFIDRGEPSAKWDEHRWVRFNSFLVALRERMEALSQAAERLHHGKRLSGEIPAATGVRPLEGHDPEGDILTWPQAQDLQTLLAALQALEAQFSQALQPQPYKPVPPPSLHVRAPL
jgi:hypothetical protein